MGQRRENGTLLAGRSPASLKASGCALDLAPDPVLVLGLRPIRAEGLDAVPKMVPPAPSPRPSALKAWLIERTQSSRLTGIERMMGA